MNGFRFAALAVAVAFALSMTTANADDADVNAAKDFNHAAREDGSTFSRWLPSWLGGKSANSDDQNRQQPQQNDGN